MTETPATRGRGSRGGRRAVTAAVLVLVLVAALVLVGVWVLRAAGEDEAAAATSDPCALVTHEEMANHIGHDDRLGPGRPPPPGSIPPVSVPGLQWCQYPHGEKGTAWVGATQPGADTRFAEELFAGWLCDNWGDAFDDCEQWKPELREWEAEGESPATGLKPVADVGVAAVWANEAKTLVVLADRQVLAFHIRRCANRFDVDSERERATLLAEKVLARDARRVIDEEASQDQPEGAKAGEVPDLAAECSAEDSSSGEAGSAGSDDATEASSSEDAEAQTSEDEQETDDNGGDES